MFCGFLVKYILWLCLSNKSSSISSERTEKSAKSVVNATYAVYEQQRKMSNSLDVACQALEFDLLQSLSYCLAMFPWLLIGRYGHYKQRNYVFLFCVHGHQSGGQEKLKYLINVLWWPHLLVSLGRHVAANGGHSGWCSTRSLKVEGVFGEDRLESLSKYFDGVVG